MKEKFEIYALSCDFDGVLNSKKLKSAARDLIAKADECDGLDSFSATVTRMLNPIRNPANMAELMVSVHAQLLKQLQEEIQSSGAELALLLNGSSRQSTSVDDENAGFLKMSVFAMLPYFANALRMQLDTALLPDGIHNTMIGETWQRRTNCNEEQLNCPFEKNKILLLFFQMQYLSNKYPNKKIVLSFVDDRAGIISALSHYFSNPENQSLVPQNIKLNLWLYEEKDDSMSLAKTINGQGPSDPHYSSTLNKFIKLAYKKDSVYSDTEEHVSVEHVTSEMLANPEPFIEEKPTSTPKEVQFEELSSPFLFSPIGRRKREKMIVQPQMESCIAMSSLSKPA